MKVLVSDHGDYVVTLDDWHAMGYGPNVVVIYRSDGSVVGRLGLQDILTAADIETLPRTSSSIRWGEGHYLDPETGELVLRVVSDASSPRAGAKPYSEIRITLATAELSEPMRDRLWHRRFIPEIVPEAQADLSVNLLPMAIERPLPPFPVLARIAKLQGSVTVELVIDPAGIVVDARALDGPVPFHRLAEDILRGWRFTPDPSGTGRLRTGGMAIRFGREDVRP